MEQIIEFFRNLFMAENWPARWTCGRWTEFHGWLYILSDLAIWSAYFAIPIIIIVVIQKRKQELPFLKVFWLFILFILACGSTHLLDAIMFWYPAYRLSSFLLLGTAIISWITAFSLIKILPRALSLKSPAHLEKIISERTAELEESNHQQKILNKNLDHFVYAASHDLKSPINNIEGLMTLLKEELEQYNNSDCASVIAKIDNSLLRVKKSINNLTEVIKVQRNPYDDIEKINFEELLNEIIIENEELIKKANAIFVKSFNVETMNYSKTGLKSILYNLVSNAVKYRSDKRQARINVSTFREGSNIVLTVEDNGIGMDLVKNKGKIFGIFNRLNDTVEGSGLGLYSIKRLIEERQGTIDVSSEPDKGTIFTIIFKLTK